MLTDAEAAHALSIEDSNPTLQPIPPEQTVRVLIASPVRKPPIVVEQFLKTLAWQQLRTRTEIHYLFAPNFSEQDMYATDSLSLLAGFANRQSSVTLWDNEEVTKQDYADGAETRVWTKPAFNRVGALKNRMLQFALDGNFDFIWFVDADVMCDPYTLQSLLDSVGIEHWLMNQSLGLPIASAVYWTRWQNPQPGSTQKVHAGPQVWLVHPYELHGRGWTEPKFREALVERKRVRVWGLGACTLIPRSAFAKGVSFANFAGLPPGGMSEGEDRHFCAWATAKHVTLIADAWSDIYHAYHPSDYGDLAENVEKLQVEHARPSFGDLVSAKIEMLEPVPDRIGRWLRVEPRWVRGKLGALPVLPQIEETVGMLNLGQSKVINLHFPAHYSEPQMQLKTFVARVTLLDAKPFGIAPVIEEEMIVGGTSRRAIDTTVHTSEQIESLLEHG